MLAILSASLYCDWLKEKRKQVKFLFGRLCTIVLWYNGRKQDGPGYCVLNYYASDISLVLLLISNLTNELRLHRFLGTKTTVANKLLMRRRTRLKYQHEWRNQLELSTFVMFCACHFSHENLLTQMFTRRQKMPLLPS